MANGVTKADLYVGGLFQGELLVGTQYYSYLPDCGDHGTVTYSEKTDKGHVIDVSTTVGIATVVKHIDTIVGVEPNECRNFRLRW